MKIAWFLLMLTWVAAAEEAKLYLQLGHSNVVTSVAFSPDGRFALTGSTDDTARLWDAKTGRELRAFRGHSNAVTSVAFSPDGRFVLTGSTDETARLWDMATGRELRTFHSTGRVYGVTSVAFSPDGHIILTGEERHTARLWDAATGHEVRKLDVLEGVSSVAFSPDGRFLLTGVYAHGARLWDAATGLEVRSFESVGVSSVAFSPNGHFVVTGGGDSTALLWDAETGQELRRFDVHADNVNSVAFSPDGRFVLTGAGYRTVQLWEAATGKELRKFESSSEVTSVAFSPNGRFVLTGNWGDAAQMWDATTGRELRQLQGHSSGVSSVAFSPDGRFLLMGRWDHTARLWEMATGREVRKFEGHSDNVEFVTFSPDGRFVLTGAWDGTARLWDVATGREVRKFEGNLDPHQCVFSPDGRFVLTGSSAAAAHLWDAATGQELRQFEGHSAGVESVAFSPDGRFVLTGSMDCTARLWDAATGQELRKFQGHSDSVESVAFSPDGRFVLTGAWDGTARLWETATGQLLRKIESPDGVGCVAFSPDGRLVVAGKRLWDTATGREVRKFEDSFVARAVAFSPDGRFVLTGSDDGTARLWDAASGRQLATLVSQREGGWAVVDPDGRYDASDPDNSPSLHFVAGNDIIELGQLKQRFYTPGLLARIWRGEKLDPLVGSLKDVKLVPAIEVQPPAAGSTIATVKLTNRGGGIGRVIVKVNGRELPTATRGATPDVNAKTAELKLDLSAASLVPNGKNVIEVFAENGDGVIRSRGLVEPWERQASEQTPPPKLYAVIVGTSSFDNPAMHLNYPAKDALDFAHALELAAEGLFGKDRTHITVLASGTQNEPSKENIRRAFDDVAKNAQPSDLLVVYFAGHGAAARSEHDQYYYFTREARSAEVDRDAGLRAVSTISSAELKEWLSRQNMPLKQVIVLDTCAAGAAFNDVVKLADRRELSPDQIRAIELLKDSTGSWILMGSAADAVSYEATRYAQGLLTYALLEGMQGKALDEGDRVEVGRLFSFAQEQVVDLAKGIGGIQRPVLSAPKGQTFPIGLLTAGTRQQIHLATLKPQLLRAQVHDEDDLDPLKLQPAIRAELRAASMPVTRGGEREEPRIVYLDSVVDEVPGALIPQVRYSVAGDQVKVRLRLIRDDALVAERIVELKRASPEEMAKTLLGLVVEECGKLK